MSQKFDCGACGGEYARLDILRRHIRTSCSRLLLGDGWLCKSCGKVFPSFDELESHEADGCVYYPKARNNKCMLCGATYCRNGDLHRHIYRVHANEDKSRLKEAENNAIMQMPTASVKTDSDWMYKDSDSEYYCSPYSGCGYVL